VVKELLKGNNNKDKEGRFNQINVNTAKDNKKIVFKCAQCDLHFMEGSYTWKQNIPKN
jgi:hypothetical protein